MKFENLYNQLIDEMNSAYYEDSESKKDKKDKDGKHNKGTKAEREKMDLDDDGDLEEYEKKKGNAIRHSQGKPHICATKVHHEKFGLGIPVYAEHAEPTDDGHVSWYTVQFQHGTEVINTTDMDILSESNHGKKRK